MNLNGLRFLVLGLSVFEVTCLDPSSQAKERHRRSGLRRPKLEMSVSSDNVTAVLKSGVPFSYKVKLKHSSDSSADAQGVRVLFMLSPFVTFKELKSYEMLKPTHAQQQDSVVFQCYAVHIFMKWENTVTQRIHHFPYIGSLVKHKALSPGGKLKEVIWSSEPSFEITVVFDEDNQLKPGKHHLVTHVQVTYFDIYVEDAQGMVTSKGTFYSEPLETMVFDIEVPGCSAALGMKSKEIHDYQVSASSSYSEAQPSQARELDDGWCAAKTSKGQQHLQVEFLQKTRVTGLATIRRQSKPHWVTEYFIIYSKDGINWKTYTENGFKKGNTISFAPTKHWLANPFEAMSVRIIPTKWESLICLRLELYGCLIEGSSDNCISPLGMESGAIPDEAISDGRTSVNPSDTNQPKHARLNAKVKHFPHGWESTALTEYLQVDFGSLRRVTKVATQGAYMLSTMFFVTWYKLSYSKNNIDWTEHSEKGAIKLFQGPVTDGKYPVVEIIQSPFVARYVRFYPTSWVGMKVMRAELYGCYHEPLPPYTGTSDFEFHRRSFTFDTTTDQFYVCMYAHNRDESSCFTTRDSKTWTAIDANIIAMVATNPRDREIYALDRQMNIYRSKDSGMSWSQISREYYNKVTKETSVNTAKWIAENFVSSLPTTNTTVTSSTGEKWGVSSSSIHFMASDSSVWSTVGSWKCCGI